jgi:hypothetical protein
MDDLPEMELKPVVNRLATTSLVLGLAGWFIYLLQWCFDLTIGLVLSVTTAGASAVCANILDFLPFALWLGGIISGHMALGQIRQDATRGRGRAIWGLVMGYLGVFFTLLLVAGVIALFASGAGRDILEKILPWIRGR